MEEKMSRWGVGPKFAVLSSGYGGMALAVSRYFDPAFRITILPKWFLTGSGLILILLGVPFFISSIKAVTKAYNSDSLVTAGVYGCCRHPLYSAWVVFIVPGIVLLQGSWIGLTTPFFMYFLLFWLVKKEEVYLEELFGEQYSDYKKQTPCILPFGRLKNRTTSANP